MSTDTITTWLGSKLVDGQAVTSFQVMAADRLQLERKSNLAPVVVAVFSQKRLEGKDLASLGEADPPVDFVVNIPKDAVIDGSAFTWAVNNGIGIGGFGDLVRALVLPDMSTYEHRDIQFIERILDQHQSIAAFERLDNRRYRIVRRRGDPIVVIFLADYELTAESVRNARARFGAFDEVVLSNPMGTSTGDANDAAHDMGAAIYTFREFRTHLRRT